MKLTKFQEKAIVKTKSFIDENPQKRIDIQHLVSYSGLSESKLTKGFKMLYQTTIYQYQLEKAMNYAKTLLDEDHQVKEVAITLGYSTSGSFARAFYRVFQERPGEYKLQ
ncbi:helix-turn-helix domain-containing protein [Chitinophaga flava]|uniref:HTH araC/xylS-type domain-containing protein n=1 Tax=Chitinophaga flava TaxID=2259036 RepID=A0A365XSK6_9BACT|nr:AraC family transcriptional regulator [Chitinophaga flava]RBL89347.1 hypothetical protein DF182_22770 [Chitinophaga flava]